MQTHNNPPTCDLWQSPLYSWRTPPSRMISRSAGMMLIGGPVLIWNLFGFRDQRGLTFRRRSIRVSGSHAEAAGTQGVLGWFDQDRRRRPSGGVANVSSLSWQRSALPCGRLQVQMFVHGGTGEPHAAGLPVICSSPTSSGCTTSASRSAIRGCGHALPYHMAGCPGKGRKFERGVSSYLDAQACSRQ